jgi:hypothetical protein
VTLIDVLVALLPLLAALAAMFHYQRGGTRSSSRRPRPTSSIFNRPARGSFPPLHHLIADGVKSAIKVPPERKVVTVLFADLLGSTEMS